MDKHGNNKMHIHLLSSDSWELYGGGDPAVMDMIEDALSTEGHTVSRSFVEEEENVASTLSVIKPDIVFPRVCYTKDNKRIPDVLEQIGLPYIGSNGNALERALRKDKCKACLKERGIPTPGFQLIEGDNALDTDLRYPLIVKPVQEGSSRGITEKSIVYNHRKLQERVCYVVNNFKQPALVEEFILLGREFTVGIVGNQKKIMMPVELLVNVPQKIGLVTQQLKDRDKVLFKPVEEELLIDRLNEIAANTFDSLEMKDICRVDIIMSRGRLYVLEVNGIPGLDKYGSYMVETAKSIGMSYAQLIACILQASVLHQGLQHIFLSLKPEAISAITGGSNGGLFAGF